MPSFSQKLNSDKSIHYGFTIPRVIDRLNMKGGGNICGVWGHTAESGQMDSGNAEYQACCDQDRA
jgi:hypothetical protein